MEWKGRRRAELSMLSQWAIIYRSIKPVHLGLMINALTMRSQFSQQDIYSPLNVLLHYLYLHNAYLPLEAVSNISMNNIKYRPFFFWFMWNWVKLNGILSELNLQIYTVTPTVPHDSFFCVSRSDSVLPNLFSTQSNIVKLALWNSHHSSMHFSQTRHDRLRHH